MKNKQGGKKHKRAKNLQINNKVDIPTSGQYFGKAEKMLGSGRVSLNYFIKIESNDANDANDANYSNNANNANHANHANHANDDNDANHANHANYSNDANNANDANHANYTTKLNESCESNKSHEWRMINTIGIIRGKMKKRVYINPGDIILVAPREFENSKVDILCKYTNIQLSYLKKHIDIPNSEEPSNNDIEFDIDIESDNEPEIKRQFNYNIDNYINTKELETQNNSYDENLDEFGNVI